MGRKNGMDEAMELLCVLPSEANPAAISELAKEFGYPTQDGIRRLIDRLNRLGYGVVTFVNKNHQRVAAISRRTWGKCQIAGLEYWGRVHESKAVAA